MKRVKRSILSWCLVISMIAGILPASAIKTGAELAENEAIFTVNFNEDGITDNIIAAEYNNTYYVMGKTQEDGTREAVEAIRRSDIGNDLVVDKTTAEILKVEGKRISYSSGSYWVNTLLTDEGYIVDGYDYYADVPHGFAVADESDTSYGEYDFYWRFSWDCGLYNDDTYGRIYLVTDGNGVYFNILPSSQEPDGTHIKAERFSQGCQHPKMEYVPAEPATCKQDGHSEFWYCPDCDDACMSPYFSDADGLNSFFNPPVTMAYGAVDADNDGVCDDCGKNMPVFKKVTEDSRIVAGGKYILVSQVGDKYFAAATGSERYGTYLPAVEITPDADGNFTFEGTTDAMTLELQFAHGCTEWGNGIRYGCITKFDGARSEFAPSYGGEFCFEEYDIRGAKYGFYVGLNEDGTAMIHSAYDDVLYIRSYTNNGEQMYAFADYSEDAAYTEAPVFLYRLTDTGTVGTNTYDMTAVKSSTDYTVYSESEVAAEGGTNVTGVNDALTQTAVDEIVADFVASNEVPDEENVHIDTGVDVEVIGYDEGNSITFSLSPVASVSWGDIMETREISDSDFDGTTAMTVVLYTGGIVPSQIIHEKQDGTNEYFYEEYSEQVTKYGKNPFYLLWDGDGNMYVTFTVTEFSDVRLLTEAVAEGVAVTGVTIDETLSVNIGETKTLVWTVSPANASNSNVTFSSSDASVAAVNAATGEVTGLAKGTAVITVTTEDGNFTAECTVTVNDGAESHFIYGDLNGDGSVNNQDFALITKYLAGSSIVINNKAADVNVDGTIDNKDYALMTKYLKGADVKLGA